MKKPIEQLWRIAAPAMTLANEWRDTISYSVGIAAAATALLHGNKWAPLVFFCATTGREALRQHMWIYHHSQLRKVGDNWPPVDPKKNEAAASIVSCVLEGAGFLSLSYLANFPPMAVSAAVVVPVFVLMGYARLLGNGGRIRDIPGLYFDSRTGMWDWPRKRGGGTTQTQKIKNGFKTLREKLAAKLPGARPVHANTLPQPVAAPR